MPDAGSAKPSGRPRGLFLCATAFIFVYYWALLTDARFLAIEPVHYGLTFNNMLEFMSRGRFDIDPTIILQEGFVRDGRTYAYFGPMPAVLRLPLLIWPRFADVDFTTISCAIGATLAALCKLAAVWRARIVMHAAPHARLIALFAMVAVVFGGSQVQFLRPSVFQEPLYWASAIAALFVLMAFRWCADQTGRRNWHLSVMAVLGGICLLTRVSTSIGLYAGCGGIMLAKLITAWREGHFPTFLAAARTIVLPSLILMAFAAICGIINYERWGSPLTFQDYRYYNSLEPNDPALTVVANYGYFNLRRLWFGLSYFFLPIWTIIRSDGHFLFREAQDRLLYIVELPPATFFASDLFLCVQCGLGVVWLWRARRLPVVRPRADRPSVDPIAAWLVAAGLLIPCVLILAAIALTFRYRMEFYPFFEFLGLFGLFQSRHLLTVRPRLFSRGFASMVVASVVCSHVFLVAYKVGPWGDSMEVERTGWLAAYRRYLDITYPALDRLIGSPGTSARPP